jgi:beta-xylosidase
VGAGAEGPFEDTSTGPLVCPTELGGAIDPSPFVAEDGRAYLLWKSDGNCCGVPTRIFSQPISDDGLQLTEPPREVLTSTLPWEAGVVEAPSMVEHDGVHYLFYSGNAWDTAEYAIGYATCDTPVGPCTKPLDHPWLGSSAAAGGPGGQELFIDPAGDLRMVFHAWLNGVVGYEAGSFRGLHTVGVDFRDGAPVTAQ